MKPYSTRLKRIQQSIFSNTSEKRRTTSFFAACYQKTIIPIADDIIYLSTENDGLKEKIGSYIEKRLVESEAHY